MFLIDTLLYIYTAKRYFGGFMKQLDKENHKMKEIEANKAAWGLLSKDHFNYCKKALQENRHFLSEIIEEELGDISGKTIIHLQGT